MENNYPLGLVEQYLKASSKLKKFERIVFKRFAPNVSEVLEEFTRLAAKFEEISIDQYAAMCYLGMAKCQAASGNHMNECHAYLKAARAFLRAHNTALQLKSNRNEYKEGALRCYTQALERSKSIDDSVLSAAIIRELHPLQPNFEGTSSFFSPAHGIHELEMAAHGCLERRDFLGALHQLDDIVDNINERKCQDLYEDLLRRVEILRILLLVALDLPPTRQSPSHIKLLEFYYHLGNFEEMPPSTPNSRSSPGCFVPLQIQYDLAEIVIAFLERKASDLVASVESFSTELLSLNSAQRLVLNAILESKRRV